MKRNHIEEIKASAQTIIDKADNIISEDDLWTSIDITIHVDFDSTTSIIIKKEVISQNMIDYYKNKS